MRAARLWQSAAAAFLTVAAGLVVSCSSRPWYSTISGACGPPALVRIDGHVKAAGNCAALLTIPALKVTVDVGQQIDVHMTEEGAGPSGNRLVPIYPLPRSSRPSVLVPVAISPDRATGTYQAIRSGQAVLLSTGSCLVDDHGRFRGSTSSCPVIAVAVVP